MQTLSLSLSLIFNHPVLVILKDVLVWLANDREMQRDRERLVKSLLRTSPSDPHSRRAAAGYLNRECLERGELQLRECLYH